MVNANFDDVYRWSVSGQDFEGATTESGGAPAAQLTPEGWWVGMRDDASTACHRIISVNAVAVPGRGDRPKDGGRGCGPTGIRL